MRRPGGSRSFGAQPQPSGGGGVPATPPRPQPAPRARPQGGTLGSFAVDLIGALGGQATPAATKLFNSWQRWEGGWSNNSARYNPLNLTAPGSGFPTINSVGVVSMPSYQVGVKRTADLIRSGYPALARAFQTGQVNFQDPALQADLNRWLTGKRTPGMSQYVSKIASAYGANVPAGATPSSQGVTQLPSPRLPQAPTYKTVWDPERFRSQIRESFIQGGGRMDLTQLPQLERQSWVLKQMPTEQLQQRGVVDPGGDLQDPGIQKGAPKGGNAVTKIAGTQIGKPYVFGSGPSTASFDCSDLIQWSYAQMGIKLPRTTFDQIKVGRAVDPSDLSNLQPGDLVFPTNHHVVMYVGGGKVIAAPHTGTVVQYQPISQFGKLLAVRRVL